MKTTAKLFALLAFVLFINSCDKEPDEPARTLATITTLEATNITGADATLGGDITSDGNSQITARGVCWSLNPNPTNSDDYKLADGSGLGEFTLNLEEFQPNTTYNYRAWVQNNQGTAYGNNVTFMTTDLIAFTVDSAFAIISSRASLRATANGIGSETVGGKGFYISDSPNPDSDDLQISGDIGDGEILISLVNLNHNTVYYARPYATANGEVYYGPEISFKTAGYFGPAGGYVVYDHGDNTEGWRYLEASPEQDAYLPWGCENQFISNTFVDYGTGLENTIQIDNNCNEFNSAARYCADYTYGGFDDWFLVSKDEAFALLRSLDDLNALDSNSNSIWTSSESAINEAYNVYLNNSNNNIFDITIGKYNYTTVIPVRRF